MSAATSINSARDRRWLILGVIGMAQLMVILDLTVMNIALPSAQRALRFTTVDRQWVVTAYTLAFGSLLLPGGRLADLLGRKVTFLAAGVALGAGFAAWQGRAAHPLLPPRGPLLEECLSRGIAFVPFCPLGWPRGQDNPVLTSPVVTQTAARLSVTPAQVALQWLLQLAPNVLLIPGTASVAHLRENLAAEGVTLDDEALCELDGVAA
jgi:hypothetical protein